MTPSRLLKLPLIGLLLAGAACDDGTSPADLGDLNPFALALALDRLQAPLQASSPALTNLRKAIPSLTAAGIAFDRPLATRFDAAFRAASLVPPAPPLALEIPPELIGKTFAYEAASAGWAVDESREGAPADGIRILWYAVDGSGEIAQPLVERGYIDLTPGENTPAEPVMVQVVSTGDGGQTLMDYGQWHDTTAVGSAETEDFGASGFYADASTTVQFSLVSAEAADSETGEESYSLDVTVESPEVAYEMNVSGKVAAGTSVYEDLLTATAVGSAGTTVLDVMFRGTADVQEDAGGTLTHDGRVVADVVINGDTFEFSRPGGGSIPAAQASELNLLFQALTLNGFNLIYRIPLFFLL